MDTLKYWLDLNNHIKQALTLIFFALATAMAMSKIPANYFWLPLLIMALLIILAFFQLILGLMQIKKDHVAYLKYKKKKK